MKIILLGLLIIEVACATSYELLTLPPLPTCEEVLKENGLAVADEDSLVKSVQSHWVHADFWPAEKMTAEEGLITSGYIEEKGSKARDTESLQELFRKLQKERMHAPERIFDAAIRELGRRGTEKSIKPLIELAEGEERLWVAWRALASVQEILSNYDPAAIDGHELRDIKLDFVAPLLRDLDPTRADAWAWKLWQSQGLSYKVTSNHPVPLRTRLWLVSAFAANHPKEAAETIQDGLESPDAAIRMAAEMIVRSRIGGSQPFESSVVQLMEAFKTKALILNAPIWEALPLPLDRPLIRESGLIRRNLIWLNSNAEVVRTTEDVWPLIEEPVAGGMYYSKLGDYYPIDIDLTDVDGRVVSRFRNLASMPFLASHGGFLAIAGRSGKVREFHPDGSVLWECRVASDVRELAPISRGRLLYLGDDSLECRDRRGDLIWRTSLKKLGDPRDIVAINDRQFLVCCRNSVGTLNQNGNYVPILEGLKSAVWIRYHPTKPWIILDGGDVNAIVFDSKTGKVTGRFDLDNGGGNGESRFRLQPGSISN